MTGFFCLAVLPSTENGLKISAKKPAQTVNPQTVRSFVNYLIYICLLFVKTKQAAK